MKIHLAITFLVLFIGAQCQAQPAPLSRRLVDDFRQGIVTVDRSFQRCNHDRNLGNCVAIAVAKAALAAFGSLPAIYQRYAAGDGRYDVTFRDGIAVSVTSEEVDTVRQLSGIRPGATSQYLDTALLIYATMCKRLYQNRDALRHGTCIRNFRNAVERLNSGYSTPEGHELLGLKKVRVDPTQLAVTPAAVIWCSAHAAYCSYGTQDLFGKAVPVRNGRDMRNATSYSKIRGAYTLAP